MICHKCGKDNFDNSLGCKNAKLIEGLRNWICLSESTEEVKQLPTKNSFYIVWSPQGIAPPKFKHSTEQSAITEARRLAGVHRGREFYVMTFTCGVLDVSYAPFEFNLEDLPF